MRVLVSDNRVPVYYSLLLQLFLHSTTIMQFPSNMHVRNVKLVLELRINEAIHALKLINNDFNKAWWCILIVTESNCLSNQVNRVIEVRVIIMVIYTSKGKSG